MSISEMVDSRHKFTDTLAREEFLLTEGSLLERIRRDPNLPLDPDVAHAALLYTKEGRAALTALWREYIEIARAYDSRILVCTPTWRANPERLARTAFPDVGQVALDAVQLLAELRADCGDFGKGVFIGGILGCRGDAYKPEEALQADEAARFHSPQVHALAQAGVDFLLAATLPAFTEALGLARAMAAVDCPYLLSFVLRPSGMLLDGTPVADAIAQIDQFVSPRPIAYLANCVHPVHFEQALGEAEKSRPGTKLRLIGLQGNTSRKSPEELDGALTLDTEDPNDFGAAMARLHERFGMRILGGCCGTDSRHIEAIARHCGLIGESGAGQSTRSASGKRLG
jgi:homocysteine S-methyltransferase